MKKDYYEELIIKSLTGEISAEENNDLSQWLNASLENLQIQKDLESAWQNANIYHENVSTNKKLAWKNIDDKTTTQFASSKPKWMFIGLAILGILAAVLGFLKFQNPDAQKEVFANLGSEKKEVELSDGSTVTLNTNSEIAFQNKEVRKVILKGEAMFDVEHDKAKPFEVHTSNTVTRVLGTTFNVDAKDQNNVQVSLIEGSVSFETENDQLVLAPGEWAGYDSNEGSLSKGIFNENIHAWFNDTIRFNGATMLEVVTTLNECFGVEIEWMSYDEKCRFTGEFIDPDLGQILSVLSATFNVTIRREGAKKIFLEGFCG